MLIQSVSMPQQSWVMPDQIRALSVQRLGNLIGRMAEDEMRDVLDALYLTITP